MGLFTPVMSFFFGPNQNAMYLFWFGSFSHCSFCKSHGFRLQTRMCAGIEQNRLGRGNKVKIMELQLVNPDFVLHNCKHILDNRRLLMLHSFYDEKFYRLTINQGVLWEWWRRFTLAWRSHDVLLAKTILPVMSVAREACSVYNFRTVSDCVYTSTESSFSLKPAQNVRTSDFFGLVWSRRHILFNNWSHFWCCTG